MSYGHPQYDLSKHAECKRKGQEHKCVSKISHTYHESFTKGVSDCFWTEEGESWGMGA